MGKGLEPQQDSNSMALPSQHAQQEEDRSGPANGASGRSVLTMPLSLWGTSQFKLD